MPTQQTAALNHTERSNQVKTLFTLSRLVCPGCRDAFKSDEDLLRYKIALKGADSVSRKIVRIAIFGKSLANVFGCEANFFYK